jgi:uncharacterized protein (DUF2164 family)
MTKPIRKWDRLSKVKKQSSINQIINFFEEERNEKLGIFEAEDILDFFLEYIGPEIYNKGVEESKELLQSRFEDISVDLDLLLDK